MFTPSRRQFLKTAGVAAGASILNPWWADTLLAAGKKPSAPVSIARCQTYDLATLCTQIGTLFDQLGGIDRLVGGKTVAVKVNLTGSPGQPALGLAAGRTYQIHPNVVLATATLLDRAGARRIRFVEGTYQHRPFESVLERAGWDLKGLGRLKAAVEYEDTRNRGKGKRYHEVKVPWGGCLFPAYLLNHSYADCDVFLSLAKLKNHVTAGVTLSMKNNFGITPVALYGHHKADEQNISNREQIFHKGIERPADGLPQEVAPGSPRVPSYRVPRHTVDAVGIRPIDLAIIDGVETVSGGEGPWIPLAHRTPGLLFAGRNPVCLDAIATTVMGYDPMAADATGPFPGTNHLAVAAKLGLGTNDPKQIEVRGLSVQEALYPFRWEPKKRNT